MRLTEREQKIMSYYNSGYRLKDIAKKLGLTVPQVKYSLRKIRQDQEVKRWWK